MKRLFRILSTLCFCAAAPVLGQDVSLRLHILPAGAGRSSIEQDRRVDPGSQEAPTLTLGPCLYAQSGRNAIDAGLAALDEFGRVAGQATLNPVSKRMFLSYTADDDDSCPDDYFKFGPYASSCWFDPDPTATISNLGAWAASMSGFAECEADCTITFGVVGNDLNDKYCWGEGSFIKLLGDKCAGQSTSPFTQHFKPFNVACGPKQNWDYWTCCKNEAQKRCDQLKSKLSRGATWYICCMPMSSTGF